MDYTKSVRDNIFKKWFSVDIPNDMKNKCPECDEKYNDDKNYLDEVFLSKDTKSRYLEYIEFLKIKFGDNAWPFCAECYCVDIDKCSSCYIPVKVSTLFLSSSAIKAGQDGQSHCIVCEKYSKDEQFKKLKTMLDKHNYIPQTTNKRLKMTYDPDLIVTKSILLISHDYEANSGHEYKTLKNIKMTLSDWAMIVASRHEPFFWSSQYRGGSSVYRIGWYIDQKYGKDINWRDINSSSHYRPYEDESGSEAIDRWVDEHKINKYDEVLDADLISHEDGGGLEELIDSWKKTAKELKDDHKILKSYPFLKDMILSLNIKNFEDYCR